MTRFYDSKRRKSAVDRDRRVIKVYRDVMAELGCVAAYVARAEIYRRVSVRIGLCVKTVANIINKVKE